MCQKCVSRRHTLAGAGAAALSTTLGLEQAKADGFVFVESLCSYAGRPRLTRFEPATRRAVDEVTQIQRVIGYDSRLFVFRGDAGNALASVVRDRRGAPRRVIVYSPRFMRALFQRGGAAAPLSVLAHEVGHHANGDLDYRGSSKHPWRKELGADYTAGLALARLGYTPDESTRALRLLFRQFGSKTHPDTPRRLEAMYAGWRDGGRRERLQLMNG